MIESQLKCVGSGRYHEGLDMWILFFFFKLKTAYEMRISDWSSDVCSSDLSRGKYSGSASCPRCRSFPVFALSRRDGVGFVCPEIGRASCRERVCQYV